MDVLILVGGKGARLHSVVNDRPKPMADINGHPFLNKLIEYVSSFGNNRIILCAGHMAEYLIEYYNDQELPIEIVFSVEDIPLGTGGAIKNAEKYIRSDDFLVMNGDSFCPVNLNDLTSFHYMKNAQISMAVAKVNNVKDYGLIRFNTSRKILSFEEKKHSDENGYINTGIYIFNKSILRDIPPNTNYSLEDDFFPSVLEKRFFAYIVENEVLDIGTPERYNFAKKYFSV